MGGLISIGKALPTIAASFKAVFRDVLGGKAGIGEAAADRQLALQRLDALLQLPDDSLARESIAHPLPAAHPSPCPDRDRG